MQLSLKPLPGRALAAALPCRPLPPTAAFTGSAPSAFRETSRKAQADTSIANLGITALLVDLRRSRHHLQAAGRLSLQTATSRSKAGVNLGKYTYDAPASIYALVATRHGVGKIDGWNLGVVGSLPLGAQFAVLGKLRRRRLQIDFHCDGTGIACANPNRKDSGTALTHGLGADWNFSGNWFARARV